MVDMINVSSDPPQPFRPEFTFVSVSGGGDTGHDRQDPGQRGGGEEETQFHSIAAAER